MIGINFRLVSYEAVVVLADTTRGPKSSS